MVGRLIEQEQIGLHHEESGEIRAHDPTAAQGICRTIEIIFAKGETGEDALGFGFDFPIVLILQCLVRLAAGELENRFFTGHRSLLRQVAENGALFERDFP